jgi:nitroimidazol reductase NimA-like FMN-containing flavoprotein (pyridoxamine 5'-phosphate oxidase superfamily)
MRRSDRAVTDKTEIIDILESCDVCRVAMKDEIGLYIVPLNYGYEFEGDKLTLYFHGAKEGRKVNTFKKGTQEVAFEIEEKNEMSGKGDLACTYTYFYRSIIGNGVASILDVKEDKLLALKSIMRNVTKRDDFKYNEQSVNNVLVMKIEVSSFTAKKH